jgi:hypothetical protein
VLHLLDVAWLAIASISHKCEHSLHFLYFSLLFVGGPYKYIAGALAVVTLIAMVTHQGE